MKLSIIISVYNSHEIVRRQMLYFDRMNLPKDQVEILIIDDGSNPPLEGDFIRSNNSLAWTQGLGRNLGAEHAKGEYLFMTDLDHIISREAIDDALKFTGNKMAFRRQLAVLLEDGTLTQDKDILLDWGWRGDKLDASVHGNTFVMRRDIFMDLGGYENYSCTYGFHPVSKKGDDCVFNHKWNRKFAGRKPDLGHHIYMFPISRYHKDGELNPKGLFHNLSQQKQEKFYKDEL